MESLSKDYLNRFVIALCCALPALIAIGAPLVRYKLEARLSALQAGGRYDQWASQHQRLLWIRRACEVGSLLAIGTFVTAGFLRVEQIGGLAFLALGALHFGSRLMVFVLYIAESMFSSNLNPRRRVL